MTTRAVSISAGPATLDGDLTVPPDARGIVVFAHGSGSSRHSSRNRHVATYLQSLQLATLLLDLLTQEEELIDARTAHLRFDIRLLAQRLIYAANWLDYQPDVKKLLAGYFGASTGGGAALVAAAEIPDRIRAVVSRGGRPDLAGPALAEVRAPSLLIVGSLDPEVLMLNEKAMSQMTAPVELQVVPGATHLFEEPGALEKVAELAGDWFLRYLR
jgi:putative phosphoribosyl transferase